MYVSEIVDGRTSTGCLTLLESSAALLDVRVVTLGLAGVRISRTI